MRNGIISHDKTVFPARLSILLTFFLLLYSLLGLRVFNVAILFDTVSKSNISYHKGVKRKDILDRNGELIATNLSTISVYANPKKIINFSHTAKKISKILPEISEKSLLKKLKSNKSFVWIKRNVSPKEQQMINNLALAGVYYEVNEKRAYPHGSLFSHVLGYVGLDGEGLSGIEKQYDEFLRDFDSGDQSLKLSLDAGIQNIVREELYKGIREFSAIGGSAIVQDPNTGEVVSMVSLPDYNPHVPGRARDSQIFNRATLGSYELGSVFKIFTVAMGIDKNIVDVRDAYDVSKPIEFKKYKIKDFYGKGGYLSVPEILMYSSNIGTVQVAFELGAENQYSYLKSLGFLSKIKVDFPEVSRPLYPAWKNWKSVNTATVSYGYGVSASPLQLIKAFNASINGGYLYETKMINNGKSKCKKVFFKRTSDLMKKMLYQVVEKGSGKKAKVDGYFVGGKSGTANKIVNGKYNPRSRISSFLAAFPIHKPKYTILISLDEPKGTKKTFGFATGGWTAAPIVSKIVKRIANIKNIPSLNGQDIEKTLELEYDTGDESKFL